FGAVHGLWCCYGYGHETPPGRWRWRSCVVGGLYVCCCGGRARWWSVSLGVLTVMLGLLPVGVIVAVGFLVDAIPGAVGAGYGTPEGDRALLGVALVAGGFALTGVVQSVTRFVQAVVGARYAGVVPAMVGRASLTPTVVSALEDPEIATE